MTQRLTQEQLEAELAMVKSCLTKPKTRKELYENTGIGTLQKKLSDWAEAKRLFSHYLVEKGVESRYYSLNQVHIDKSNPIVVKVKDKTPCKGDYIHRNGNSTVYKFTDWTRPQKRNARERTYAGSIDWNSFI